MSIFRTAVWGDDRDSCAIVFVGRTEALYDIRQSRRSVQVSRMRRLPVVEERMHAYQTQPNRDTAIACGPAAEKTERVGGSQSSSEAWNHTSTGPGTLLREHSRSPQNVVLELRSAVRARRGSFEPVLSRTSQCAAVAAPAVCCHQPTLQPDQSSDGNKSSLFSP